HEAGRQQAIDEGIEQGLGLRINPMQVLKHQQQRLHLAFAQQETLERLEGALTPLRWIELPEGTVVWQSLQERQEGRDGVLQPLIERQYLPGHAGSHTA